VNDGIIKYSIEHTVFDARIPYDLYGELEAVRSRLHRLGLIGINEEGIGYGNISAKESAGDSLFYITATQTGHLERLGTSLYTQVTGCDFDTFVLRSKGKEKPSSEAFSHAMVYGLDPAIRAVIHIHSLALWKFMLRRKDLATKAPYGTLAMTEEIAALYLKQSPLESPMFVMKGHEEGIMIFAESLQKAEKELLGLLGDYLNADISDCAGV
jgi:ribulose-5-phosphate 4-epimerase/fuculose-1-phosphate aldolase